MFSYLVFVVSYYFLFSRADARDTRAVGKKGGAHKERRRRTRSKRQEEVRQSRGRAVERLHRNAGAQKDGMAKRRTHEEQATGGMAKVREEG